MTLPSEIRDAQRIEYRRVALHGRCRCNLNLMYWVSILRWNKVFRMASVMRLSFPSLLRGIYEDDQRVSAWR